MAPQVPALRLSASGHSPSVPPGFPCFPFSSRYLASCQFPFALPCFAPTTVPQVITLRSHARCFSLSLAFFRPLGSGSCYSASRFYFSLHPASPNGGSVRANLSAFHSPVSMLASGFGTQHAASSVHRSLSRHTAATPASPPFPFGSRLRPHSKHLRFRLLGIRVIHPEN